MGSRLTKVAGSLRPRMRIPDRASDSETALLRYLVYGLLPVWFIPGLLDWNQHRRRPLPAGYLATIGLGVLATIVVPYGEELARCVKGDKE